MMRVTLRITVATLLVLAVAGCYWTPDQSEGGIALRISAGEIGASATLEDFDGIFFAYVIGTDLLRGDEDAADDAFSELNESQTEAFQQFFQEAEDPDNVNLEDFDIRLSLPSYRLQANLFSGTSGSVDFRGLSDGQEFAVVVIASSAEAEQGNFGFTTVTIEAGETKTVDIDVSNSEEEFATFLTDRFGYTPPTPPPVELATLTITTPPSDGFPMDPGADFYYDLVSADTPDPSGGSDQSFGEWYDSVTVLDKNGDEIDRSTGSRPAIPSDDTSEITGVAAGSWRLLLTTVEMRTNLEGSAFLLSEVFTTSPGETTTLDLPNPGEVADDPATIEITVPQGFFPETVYFDLVPGTTQDYNPEENFETWFDDLSFLNAEGEIISTTGTRLSADAGETIQIEDVAPGLFLRLFVGDSLASDRTDTPEQVFLSEAFTTEAGQTISVDLAGAEFFP